MLGSAGSAAAWARAASSSSTAAISSSTSGVGVRIGDGGVGGVVAFSAALAKAFAVIERVVRRSVASTVTRGSSASAKAKNIILGEFITNFRKNSIQR